jgi:hypothetical protein
MKVRLAVALTVLMLLVQANQAMAAWGPFVSLGTNTVNSDASCTGLTGGTAVCGARSLTNTMLVNHFNGTAWAGWKNLAGTITSAPSCAPDGNGQAICAARSTAGGMVYTIFNGTVWSAESSVTGSPRACSTELHGVHLPISPRAQLLRQDVEVMMPGACCV